MLYCGTAGVVPVLLEGWRHFGDDSFADTALRAARSLADAVEGCEDSSLYFGLTGMALALRTVHDELGDTASGAAADRAMELVRSRFGGTRWGELFELMGGNAGIGLGALLLGDEELAVLALEPYLRTAEKVPSGVHWGFRTGREGRMHHVSHGTLGIVYALATGGTATGRDAQTSSSWPGPVPRASWRGTRTAPTGSWSRTPTRHTCPTGTSATATAGVTGPPVTPRSSGS
jgi:hypothetical protein